MMMGMKRYPRFLILVLCCIASLSPAELFGDTAKITVKVLDDEGKSVAGFPVKADFYGADKFRGLTDTNGIFIMEGQVGYVHEANWVWRKEGYYYGHDTYQFEGPVSKGSLQPWNPVMTAVVRRVINPIPMYEAAPV